MFAVLADDQIYIREAVSLVLNKLFGFNVLQAQDATEALFYVNKFFPQLAILDIMMPGMDTFEAARRIRESSPRTKVIILTGRAEVDLVLRARQAKIHGYVLKGDSREEVHYAIKTVMKGGIYVPPSLSHLVHDPERNRRTELDALTHKERAVLSLFARGMAMKEIADVLNISIKTAETHRNNFGRKLGNPNKAQLFAFALKHSLVDQAALAIPA